MNNINRSVERQETLHRDAEVSFKVIRMSESHTREETVRSRRRAPPAGRSRVAVASASSVAGLGAKLRSARERAEISVRELGRRVQVSPSLISQIERGRVTPSVGTLYAIVYELGLGLDELFRDDGIVRPIGGGASAASGARGLVQRRNSRKSIRLADGVRWELLTPAPDPDLEFLYVVYEVGAESCPGDSLTRHGGMEYAYVISGRLGVTVGFEDFELQAGDSLSFDAQRPHRLWTVGRRPAVAVWAVLNRSGDKRRRCSWR